MLTTQLASGHPTLDPRLLTLHRLSISGMSFQSPIVINELFLIVFCESKVVKSMICTPTCGQPCREPPPNVHIWPRLALEKGSKSAFFNAEVEIAQDGFQPSLRMSADNSLTELPAVLAHIGETTRRCFTHVPFEPHSNSQILYPAHTVSIFALSSLFSTEFSLGVQSGKFLRLGSVYDLSSN